ncbi:hypothetical protein [Mycobacterium sp.]|uniref:hypothetical protein n=1 Tax=Mycobacterium sp. TaxID=1785 RepID=UPI002D680BC3|nr:hypothetical protein [Mycobacterium sp.]HZA09831.1 hypothetical protein [Mycobacterium sp.]
MSNGVATGAKVAAAVGAGYLLGRTRKMRLAMMLAAAGITGKFPARPTDLVAHGLKSLGASAELSELTEQLRGEVLNAARAAALTAATHQVDALNNRLQGATGTVDADEVLDDVGETVGDTVDGSLDTVGRSVASVTGLRRGRRRDEDEDLYDEAEGYDDAEDEQPLDVDEEEGANEDFAEVDEEPELEDIDEEPEEDQEPELEDIDEEPEDEEPPRAVTRRRATRQPTRPRASGRRSGRADSVDEPSVGAARRRPSKAATKRAPVRRGR